MFKPILFKENKKVKMAETTFVRTHKDRNYTVLDNTFIRDVTLSWKAKGVMTYLLSLPDDWSVNFSEVLRHSTDGETALKSTIKELKDHGYLISKRLQSAEGKFTGFTYEIVENPKANNHQVEKPSGGKPTEWINHRVENDQLLNTNNTKYINKLNTISSRGSEEHNTIISFYYECFKKALCVDVVPEMDQSSVRSRLSVLLKKYSVDELKEIIEKAMSDNFIVDTLGFPLMYILKGDTINKLKFAKGSSTTFVNNKRPALANQVTEEDINF